MSLIKCPECGNDVSDSAEICPKCGYGIKKYLNEKADKEKQEIENEELYTTFEKEIVIPTKRPSFITVWHVLAVILFLIGCCIVVWISALGQPMFGLLIACLFWGISCAIYIPINISTSAQVKMYDKYHDNPEEYKEHLIKYRMKLFNSVKEREIKENGSTLVKCPKCGSVVDNSFIFCDKCGYKLK